MSETDKQNMATTPREMLTFEEIKEWLISGINSHTMTVDPSDVPTCHPVATMIENSLKIASQCGVGHSKKFRESELVEKSKEIIIAIRTEIAIIDSLGSDATGDGPLTARRSEMSRIMYSIWAYLFMMGVS